MNPLHEQLIGIVRDAARRALGSAALLSQAAEEQKPNAVFARVLALVSEECQSAGERLAALAGTMSKLAESESAGDFDSWAPLLEEGTRLTVEQCNRIQHAHEISVAAARELSELLDQLPPN